MRLLALAALLLFAAPAAADPIAQVGDQGPIAAHGGWVVWSARQGAAFRLFAWHDGTTTELKVRGRQRPFDVDIGTDARGRAVATFSRCRGFHTIPAYEIRREVGTDCRIRVVDLKSGRERGGGVPEPRGVSDAWPSMWRGRIAFARRQPKLHRDVDQVVLWHHGLTSLRHGAMPTRCPFPTAKDCAGIRSSGEVTGLDLGARLVAFSWRIQAPAVYGHGGFEVRADRLSDGSSALVGSGYIGEACTGGIDGTTPAAPTVDADRVWYSQTATDCYRVTTTLNSYAPFPVRGLRGALAGTVLQAVKDGSNVFELVAPSNGPNEPVSCTPCSIEQISPPALRPISRRPGEPLL